MQLRARRVPRLEARDEEVILTGDYSGLEVGVQGEWCVRLFDDRQILDMYLAQARGEDIHCNNAKEVFGRYLGWTVPDTMVSKKGERFVPQYAGQNVLVIPTPEFKAHPFGGVLRNNIKEIWYGFAYGKRGYGFATLRDVNGRMIGEDRAEEMCDGLMKAVPGTGTWPAWVDEYVLEHRGIYSLGGRWCPLYDLIFDGAPKWMIGKACRRAYNFPMQATGAEIIGDAMLRVGRCPILRKLGFRIVLQVHDELVLIGPLKHLAEASALLKQHMEAATANGVRLITPLQVGIGSGRDYAAAK